MAEVRVPTEQDVEAASELPRLTPAIVIGVFIHFGRNPGLAQDVDVCTVEMVVQVPGPNGSPMNAIMPIVMDVELAESIGLKTTINNSNAPEGATE